MQTETIQAWQVEEGDYITLGSETTFNVATVEDHGSGITLHLIDDDGEGEQFSFMPWEEVTYVTSFEDED